MKVITRIFFFLSLLGLPLLSHGQSLKLVVGNSCANASASNYTIGTDLTVSVCATAPVSTCGASIQLVPSAAANNDRFRITARTRAATFDTDNNGVYTLGANTITLPANTQDFGASNATPVAAAAGTVVATFTISPQATATNASYTISFGGVSSVLSTATTCGAALETPATGTFTLTNVTPVATAPTASLAAGPTLSAAGTGTQTVNILTQGSLTGSLGLACSILAPANTIAITSNANQTINATPAPGATGAAIGLSCSPAVGVATTATLSCAQTATPAGAALPNLTSTITCPAAPTPAAPTVSALAPTTLTGGTGTVPVTVATAGVATASLALGCTIPATGASNFLVTTGGTRTITAPATVGANAPAVGLSCVPQLSGAVIATLTCTQTATPGGALTSLTSAITCPAAPTATITAVTPPGAVTLPGYSVGVPSSSTPLSFNVTGASGALACVPTGAGYSATPNPLNLVVGTAGTVTVVYTGSTPGTFPGTLVCTSTAPAGGGPFTYNLSTTVSAAPPPNVVVPTMGAAGLGLMSLMLIGLAAFQRRRRQL